MKLYESDATRALLNCSGINNIPTLNLVTTNPEVVKANNCGKGPVFIGATGKDLDCIDVYKRQSTSSDASSINADTPKNSSIDSNERSLDNPINDPPNDNDADSVDIPTNPASSANADVPTNN